MRFGDKIRFLRENKGLKQTDIGNALNVSGRAVSMWEHNMRVPKMGVIYKLATYLGVSVDYLVNDNEEISEEISFNDFDYALKAETSDLTDEQKQALLNMAKVLKNQNK